MDITARVKAVDEASRTFKNVGAASQQMGAAAKRTAVDMKALTTGMSGVATAGFGLYSIYDKVGNAQIALQSIQVSHAAALTSVETAQTRLNKAIEKYGPNSEEAALASQKLSDAQARVEYYAVKLEDAQGNVNEAMVQGAMMAGPMVMTMGTQMGGVLKSLGVNLGGLGGTFTSVLPKMAGAFRAFGMAMMANPVFLVIAAIAAAVMLLYMAWTENWGGIREFTAAVFEALQGIFQGLIDAGQKVIDFFAGLGEVIGSTLKTALNGAIWVLNRAIDGINLLIRAYNVIIGSIPGVPTIGELKHIPALQRGGIITRPTLAMVGEAGPEAVVPLEKGAAATETLNVIITVKPAEFSRFLSATVLRERGRRRGPH